jgi:hypothetical protein
MARRWPIHPIPYRAEALSSWLARIAASYELTTNDLLVHDLSLGPLSERQLDIDPPEGLFTKLNKRTGVATDRVRRMTARAFSTRLATKSISSRELFEVYAARYSVLFSERHGSFEEIDEDWRPWISNDRFKEPWVCEGCLEGGSKPHIKLHWKFPITLSCPAHRQFLKPITLMGNIDLRPLVARQRTPPTYIVQLDAATEQAMLGRDIKLGRVRIPANIWFPLLRSCLTELDTPPKSAGRYHYDLRDLWRCCNLKPRGGAPEGWRFEDLTVEYQARFLEMAALTICLLADRQLQGKGRDLHLIRGPGPCD